MAAVRVKAAKSSRTSKPWELPSDLEPGDIYAVQALAQGKAGEAEQLRVWQFVRRLAQADLMSFWPGPDGDRATAFAEGKRFVADQLRRISRLKQTQAPSRGEPPPMPAPNQE